MNKLSFNRLTLQLDGDVEHDVIARCLHATDASIFNRQPTAVVYPKNTVDVLKTVDFCRAHKLSIHPRGAGSGLCGSALGTGVIVDFTRYMNRLMDLDLKGKTFTCEPGYRFGELEKTLVGQGLFFPPDPSSGEYASFGGMVGTNASGAHSVKYGNVADYLIDADIVLSTGQLITLTDLSAGPVDALPDLFRQIAELYLNNQERIESSYPPVRHNVTGYNLRGMVRENQLHLEKLITGAEGTLGIAVSLKFRLLEKPAADSLVVAFFDDIEKSARAVQHLLPMGPAGIEVMDKSLLELARDSDPVLKARIPAGVDNVLLVEFDGHTASETEGLAVQARTLIETHKLSTAARLAVSAEEKKRFWAIRKAAVPILYKLKGEKKILALVEDAVVPTDRLVEYFKGIYQIMEDQGVRFVVYGHIAKGLLHTRPLLDLTNPADIARLKPLADAVFELVSGLGGAVSGEHGDGRLRSAYIERQYPQIVHLFRDAKRLLDPHNLLNPEIKTASTPDQMTRHLRYGADYRRRPGPPKTLLDWPDGWETEIERCHGCSKCTTVTTATRMCPIYKFTRHEAAAPKAKANVLRALISGAVDDAMLYERRLQDVIDHCVGCGSCSRECPSEVNIPKMAIEARARYVERFGPSLHSRLVTAAEDLGRRAGPFSGLLKPAAKLDWLRRTGQLFTGISANRPMITPARHSLFDQIPSTVGSGKPQVLYFSGCYAGYLRPAIGQALVRVLERLGMTVYTPPQHCCGLPQLTKGMVGQAREKVRANLSCWVGLLERVDYVVVTCSSCGLALTTDWLDLLDDRQVHQAAEKTIHFSRLVSMYTHRCAVRPWPAQLAYHQPCHLKIQAEPDSSLKMLQALPGTTVDALDSHCCGMAGTWGLAAKNDSLSRRIGQDLIDRIDATGADIAVTDCPTCEMQMAALGRLPVMHPVEVVEKGMGGGGLMM
ncbi:FAD-linked oxidoreductase [Desulfosarcina variabilis str. Montpellier]|uniref:FAD-binding and (Fe-S)-binding domain-containing protein n=1 Tax=Desulfosarcina variabilis TaxID=2300 RepID=UPI003AFB2723